MISIVYTNRESLYNVYTKPMINIIQNLYQAATSGHPECPFVHRVPW